MHPPLEAAAPTVFMVWLQVRFKKPFSSVRNGVLPSRIPAVTNDYGCAQAYKYDTQ